MRKQGIVHPSRTSTRDRIAATLGLSAVLCIGTLLLLFSVPLSARASEVGEGGGFGAAPQQSTSVEDACASAPATAQSARSEEKADATGETRHGGRQHAAPSLFDAIDSPLYSEENSQHIGIALRDMGDEMMTFSDDGSISVTLDGYRGTDDPLVIGTAVEWVSDGLIGSPARSVEIRLPDHLFLSRDGTPYEPTPANGATGPLLRNGYAMRLSVPEAPAVSADGWQYRRDEAAHEVVIVNARDIDAGTKFVCEIDYEYDSNPGYFHGTVYDGALHSAFTELSDTPVRLYAELHGAVSTTPAITVHTQNELKSLAVDAVEVHEERLDSWEGLDAEAGRPPAEVYVVWEATVEFSHFYQPFDIRIEPKRPSHGTIVGVSDMRIGPVFRDPDASSPALSSPSEALLSMSHDDVYAAYTESSGYLAFKEVEVCITVLVRYEKADLEGELPLEFDMTAAAILTGVEQDPQTIEGTGTFEYAPVEFVAPPGNEFFLARRSGAPDLAESSVLSLQEGQLDRLESGMPTMANANVNAAYASCFAATLREGGDPTDARDYGVNPYTVEIIDGFSVLRSQTLGVDDYEITSILDINAAAVTLFEGIPDYATGEFSTRPIDGAIDRLDVTVSVASGTQEEWTAALRWTQTQSGRIDLQSLEALAEGVEIHAFDPATVLKRWSASDALSHFDGERRYDVTLPPNVTGVKISFETTAWAAGVGDCFASDPKFGLTTGVVVKPSNAVLSLVEGMDTASRIDINTLVARDSEKRLLGFEGLPDGITEGSAVAAAIEERDLDAYGARMFHGVSSMAYSRPKRSGGMNLYATNPRNDTLGKTVEICRVSSEARFVTKSVESGTPETPVPIQPPEQSGTFYLLMPAGFAADVSTLRAAECFSGGMSRVDVNDLPIDGGAVKDERYVTLESGKNVWEQSEEAAVDSVELVSDWRGSGRDLVVVHVETAEGRLGYDPPFGNAQYTSGFILSLGGSYGWDAVADHGSSLSFATAYRSDNLDMEGWGARRNESASDISGGFIGWSEEEKELMSNLDEKGSSQYRWLYSKTRTTFGFPTAAEYGLSLAVKAIGEPEWVSAGNGSDVAEVYAGSQYQYKIRTTLEKGSTATENVLFLPLERYVYEGRGSEWRGTLEHVDTSAIAALGIRPKVFYSSTPGIDVSNPDVRDLTNATVWSSTAPDPIENTTAIAIDCSSSIEGGPYTLTDASSLVAVVTMRAPAESAKEIEQTGGTALCQVWLDSIVKSPTGASSSKTLHREYTAAVLKTFSLSFVKMDARDAARIGEEGLGAVSDAKGLEGAAFDLYRLNGAADALATVDGDSEEWQLVQSAVSDPNVVFEGLAEGVYRLVETHAPEGYRLPQGQWSITLNPLVPNEASIEEVRGGSGEYPPCFVRLENGAFVLGNVALPSLPATGAKTAAGIVIAGVVLLAAGIFVGGIANARNKNGRA